MLMVLARSLSLGNDVLHVCLWTFHSCFCDIEIKLRHVSANLIVESSKYPSSHAHINEKSSHRIVFNRVAEDEVHNIVVGDHGDPATPVDECVDDCVVEMVVLKARTERIEARKVIRVELRLALRASVQSAIQPVDIDVKLIRQLFATRSAVSFQSLPKAASKNAEFSRRGASCTMASCTIKRFSLLPTRTTMTSPVKLGNVSRCERYLGRRQSYTLRLLLIANKSCDVFDAIILVVIAQRCVGRVVRKPNGETGGTG